MKNTENDIVIVGSGLGGLACGSILSKAGYKVCILEKHYQIGGCLQNFKRKGKIFDTGMHYIGSFGEGEILNKLFKYFGIYDKIVAKRLDEDAFDILTFGNEKFAYPQGVENFRNKLFEKFPEEKDGINKYFEKINEIYNSVDILNLREIRNDNLGIKNSMDVNAFEFHPHAAVILAAPLVVHRGGEDEGVPDLAALHDAGATLVRLDGVVPVEESVVVQDDPLVQVDRRGGQASQGRQPDVGGDEFQVVGAGVAVRPVYDQVVGAAGEGGGQFGVRPDEAGIGVAPVQEEDVVVDEGIHVGQPGPELEGVPRGDVQLVDVLGPLLGPGGAGVPVDQGGAPGGVVDEAARHADAQVDGLPGRAVEGGALVLEPRHGRLGVGSPGHVKDRGKQGRGDQKEARREKQHASEW